MSPSKAHVAYTPEHMKQVLQDALSPSDSDIRDSPLFHKRATASRTREAGYDSSSSSDDEDHDQQIPSSSPYPQQIPSSSPYPQANEASPLLQRNGTTYLGHASRGEYTTPLHPRGTTTAPGLALNSSPIRPLDSSPTRRGNFTPARTFEVESSFLQAMIGLLERQANIVPDHVITKSEVRKMVRKEIASPTTPVEDVPRSLSNMVAPSRIMM
ncbi:hypothetical protein BDV95DRAFT_669179, partial [Massariosphaeria phaeospora]